jgi:hypothetical protein
MRSNLTAVRQRVERLASTMAAACLDLSRLSDEELLAEALAAATQLDPCSRCGYDMATAALAELRAGRFTDLWTCPRCHCSIRVAAAGGCDTEDRGRTRWGSFPNTSTNK